MPFFLSWSSWNMQRKRRRRRTWSWRHTHTHTPHTALRYLSFSTSFWLLGISQISVRIASTWAPVHTNTKMNCNILSSMENVTKEKLHVSHSQHIPLQLLRLTYVELNKMLNWDWLKHTRTHTQAQTWYMYTHKFFQREIRRT